MKFLDNFYLSTVVSISVEWLKKSWAETVDSLSLTGLETLLRFWEFLKLKAICYTTIISSRERVTRAREIG